MSWQSTIWCKDAIECALWLFWITYYLAIGVKFGFGGGDTVRSATCRKRLNAAKHRTTKTVERCCRPGRFTRAHAYTPSSWTWAVLWLHYGWTRQLSPPRRTPWGYRLAWGQCRRCVVPLRLKRLCFPAWQPGPPQSPGHRPPSDSAHKRGCRGSTSLLNASYACLKVSRWIQSPADLNH